MYLGTDQLPTISYLSLFSAALFEDITEASTTLHPDDDAGEEEEEEAEEEVSEFPSDLKPNEWNAGRMERR